MKVSLPTLRTLAGEGEYHLYQLLKTGKRLFIFLKCLWTSLGYLSAKTYKNNAKNIVLLKGSNQINYHRQAQEQLEEEFGELSVFTTTTMSASKYSQRLISISYGAFLKQLTFLSLMLLTGRKRYLNLYLLHFHDCIHRHLEANLTSAETFICYNDQPYDVAAVVNSLNTRPNCTTIVIQHGLILNEKFYFPSNTKEFWAWGTLSETHYKARKKNAMLIIKGRYKHDINNLRQEFNRANATLNSKFLISPSHLHAEAKELLTSALEARNNCSALNTVLALKFHPATKMKLFLRVWAKIKTSKIVFEHESMEILAAKYDGLITKNSTSAIEFLLRGKPVIFTDLNQSENFPSLNFGLDPANIDIYSQESQRILMHKNKNRIDFLLKALNVQ